MRSETDVAIVGSGPNALSLAAHLQIRGVERRIFGPPMRFWLDMPAGKGVIVQDVKPQSFAEDVGLGRGDIILEINKQPVNTGEEFARVESGLKSGQDVVFLVRQRGTSRQDGTIFVAGTLP